MTSEQGRESTRQAFLRFGLTGIVFTILGPGLFWLAYPMGPFRAVALAEITVHTARFVTFRIVVFPARKGYRVNLRRYVLSALPVSLTGLASVALLRNYLDRTTITLIGTLIAVIVGFLWSHFVYALPIKKFHSA
jgi:putative flippase GtrA